VLVAITSNAMPKITADIPVSLTSALKKEIDQTGADESSIVTAALAEYLETPVHTLFQVSTSGALVTGVFSGAVGVQSLLQHGDMGLGTFANLDGEMVVLDHHAFQVQGSGRVSEAPANARVPFAVVTEFSPDIDSRIGPITSFAELEKQCDSSRKSGNIFYAFRIDGRFKRIRTRAVNPPESGTRLVDAAKSQSEFHFSNVAGTLVGLWSPGFSSAFSVAGYHFHFLSDDRQEGGHLLDLESEALRLRVEALTEFHLALPETEAFLKADLARTLPMNSRMRNRLTNRRIPEK
jgi:acetolactate decarboxylase